MSGLKKIAAAAVLAALVGCRELPNPFAGDKVIAKVGDRSLVLMDVESIFTPGLSEADSVALLESYVDMWVKKQLKLQRAEELFHSSAADIDKMVDEYRDLLLSRKLDQYIVDHALDTVFSDKEIEEYYNRHQEEFTLDRNIVKGTIVTVPRGFRQRGRIKEMLKARSEEKRHDLEDMCAKNNLKLDRFASWTDFDKFLASLPVRRTDNFEGVLSRSDVQEMDDKDNYYYFVIEEFRKTGSVTPREMVRDVIRRIIFNQRKTEIIRGYEDSLYRKALSERDVVVNVERSIVKSEEIN